MWSNFPFRPPAELCVENVAIQLRIEKWPEGNVFWRERFQDLLIDVSYEEKRKMAPRFWVQEILWPIPLDYKTKIFNDDVVYATLL